MQARDEAAAATTEFQERLLALEQSHEEERANRIQAEQEVRDLTSKVADAVEDNAEAAAEIEDLRSSFVQATANLRAQEVILLPYRGGISSF